MLRIALLGSVFCSFCLGILFSVSAMAASNAPVWPTDLQTPEKNHCVECRCPKIMDDGKYALEQILSPARGYHYSELFLKCPGMDVAGIWNTTLYNHQADNSRDSIARGLQGDHDR